MKAASIEKIGMVIHAAIGLICMVTSLSTVLIDDRIFVLVHLYQVRSLQKDGARVGQGCPHGPHGDWKD